MDISNWRDYLPDPILVFLVGFLCFAFLGPLVLTGLSIYIGLRQTKKRTATLLVLGDVGRSPRMMYHADSLAKHGWETYVVGYSTTPPISSLLANPKVHLIPVRELPKLALRLPWLFRAPMRMVTQFFSVLYITLFKIPFSTEIFLVQNPPSMPTLFLAQMVSSLSGAWLIIDWHNTGYSILGMRLGKGSLLVSAAKAFEGMMGQEAYAHLFVTEALRDSLVDEWKLKGATAVLHDRPPSNFRHTTPMEQHELFTRLAPTLDLPSALRPTSTTTLFTEASKESMPVLRADRPALLVSSTSWTADEDFTLLLTALDHYQSVKTASMPRLFVVITGLGAMRAAFEKAVAQREKGAWKDITVRCIFVEARDYPVLLGCADLGVSLHTSSSGKDLPMKVVDMFGCGVPVLAKGYECIGELVKDGKNGRIFGTGAELGEQLIDLLTSFPKSTKLDTLTSYFSPPSAPVTSGDGVTTRRRTKAATAAPAEGDEEWTTWDENWDRVMYSDILDFRKKR